MVQLGKMSTDLQSKLDDHETRLSAVERRQDAQGDKLDSISRDLSAIRAEGNARAVSAAHSIDQVRGDIHGLTVQLAEYTGAQKRQTELEALKTQRWRRVSIILGIVFAFGAILGKGGVQVGNGEPFIIYPSTSGAYSYITASDATTFKLQTSGGGDASLSGVYNLTSSGAATFSGSLIIPFGTPASSTAACTQGQTEMDATYTYSCVATNTWHRVENGATWQIISRNNS